MTDRISNIMAPQAAKSQSLENLEELKKDPNYELQKHQ